MKSVDSDGPASLSLTTRRKRAPGRQQNCQHDKRITTNQPKMKKEKKEKNFVVCQLTVTIESDVRYS